MANAAMAYHRLMQALDTRQKAGTSGEPSPQWLLDLFEANHQESLKLYATMQVWDAPSARERAWRGRRDAGQLIPYRLPPEGQHRIVPGRPWPGERP